MNTVRTSKDIRKLTAELTALKNTITDLKNKLEWLSSRLDEAEGKINLCQREYKSLNQKNSPPSEHEKEKRMNKKGEENLKRLMG